MSCKYLLVLAAGAMLASCKTVDNASQFNLHNDYYRFHQEGNKPHKVYVSVTEDTVRVVPVDKDAPAVKPETDEYFLRHGFDVDILIAPAKYRPSSAGFPRQLAAEFNGNIFLGYRADRFRVKYSMTPAGSVKQIRHRAITAGMFMGCGATSVTPWTTNYQTTDEYSGFILSRGVATMVGINNLTVGVGVGWDYLTDRDRHIWIYQNRPWLGLILSLNLN